MVKPCDHFSLLYEANLIISIEWLLYAKLGISALNAYVNEPPNNLVYTVALEKLSHLPVKIVTTSTGTYFGLQNPCS